MPAIAGAVIAEKKGGGGRYDGGVVSREPGSLAPTPKVPPGVAPVSSAPRHENESMTRASSRPA